MKSRLSTAGIAALFLGSALAVAAPPAPTITAAAGGVKQLRFDWAGVSGATSYELWFQSNASAAESRFFQLPASQRSVTNNVSVHLLDWTNARYWLKACDSSGCSSSAKLSVANRMPDVIGLLSSPTQQTASQFGYAVALSDDGQTLAVSAPFESTSDPQFPKGSAYIYRKSGGSWVLQATVPYDVSRNGQTNTPRLALNAAGNVLAVALPGDFHHTQQGDGYGTVKVFRLVFENGWRHEATISMQTGFEYGSADWLDLDDAGDTLAVHTSLGVPGQVTTNADRSATYIYSYTSAGTWQHTGTAPGHGEDVDQGTGCAGHALSGDGKVLAYFCGSFEVRTIAFEVHAAPDWGIRDTLDAPPGTRLAASALDFTGDALAVQRDEGPGTARTEIWRRTAGSYHLETTLRAGAWQPAATTQFGRAAAFSTDGKLLVIGDPADQGAGTGSLAPPLTAGTKATGAVYVYDRRTNGWTLRRVVKPGRSGTAYEVPGFGAQLAIGDNGKTLVVGQSAAASKAGAVWIY